MPIIGRYMLWQNRQLSATDDLSTLRCNRISRPVAMGRSQRPTGLRCAAQMPLNPSPSMRPSTSRLHPAPGKLKHISKFQVCA